MTEKEKMLAGMVYSAVDKQLLEELNAVKELFTDIMSSPLLIMLVVLTFIFDSQRGSVIGYHQEIPRGSD